jgi:hypothetical protein
LLRIPDWVSLGTVGSGQVMYWVVGAFFIISGIVVFNGLSDRISDDNKVAMRCGFVLFCFFVVDLSDI